MRVGIQGEAGCFSHAALHRLLGGEADARFYRSFPAAVAALEAGETDRLLLPVHNTLAGVVAESLRAIAASDLRIDDEIELPIRLVCAALPGTRIDQVSWLRSHPVALRQCSRFLAHHPRMSGQPVHDTAGAARLLAEHRESGVAVATSADAARQFGLVTLMEDIQDRADNVTRFWLLAARQLADPGVGGRMHRHLAAHVESSSVASLRGAIAVPANTPDAISESTAALLDTLLAANGLSCSDVISAIFTMTPDLNALFPANAARQAGWHGVPMLCATEVAVPGALPRCLRLLLHVRPPRDNWEPSHQYLGEARALRPDL